MSGLTYYEDGKALTADEYWMPGRRVADIVRTALEIDREAWEERGEVELVDDAPRTHSLTGRVDGTLPEDEAYTMEYRRCADRDAAGELEERDGRHWTLGTHRPTAAGRTKRFDRVVVGSNPDAPLGRQLDPTPRAWLVDKADLC